MNDDIVEYALTVQNKDNKKTPKATDYQALGTSSR
jgi:hypothetical protein